MPKVSAREAEEFESFRPRLFSLAYRLLGSAAEAEDAVQDAYLRWHAADRAAIETPAAWRTRVVTNLCLNRMASARVRREAYVGPWLPEPVMTEGARLGPMESAEQREAVSMAMLLLLERLTPAERAAFVLREAFGHSHREIAAVLEISEAGAQQLYHRARERVAEGRPRFRATRAEGRAIAERFLRAAAVGDLRSLESLLAADVAAWADGGGKSTAARRVIVGAAKVARYLGSWVENGAAEIGVAIGEINGQPALYGVAEGRLLGVMVLEITDGLVSTVRTVVNPDKLVHMNARLRSQGPSTVSR